MEDYYGLVSKQKSLIGVPSSSPADGIMAALQHTIPKSLVASKVIVIVILIEIRSIYMCLHNFICESKLYDNRFIRIKEHISMRIVHLLLAHALPLLLMAS
jgi:hypothetical protein